MQRNDPDSLTFTSWLKFTRSDGTEATVLIDLAKGKPPRVCAESLAELIWTDKRFMRSVRMHISKVARLRPPEYTYPTCMGNVCMPIDACVAWLAEHHHKDKLALKQFKAFVDTDLERMRASVQRVITRRVRANINKSIDQIADFIGVLPAPWMAEHGETVADLRRAMGRMQGAMLSVVESPQAV